MKNLAKPLVSLLLAIVSLFLLMQVAALQDISIENIQLSRKDAAPVPISFPFQQNIVGDYRVTLDLKISRWGSKKLQIIPDDELLAMSVNGKDISLKEFSRNDLRNYHTGIKITLDALEHDQVNRIELLLKNESNPAGLNIKSLSTVKPIALLLTLVILTLLVYALSRHIKLDKAQYVILGGGLLVALAYLSVTDPATRTFDVYEGGGHRDYIEYLIKHKTTPPPGEGWEYHQPPLYYTIGALSKTLLTGSHLHADNWGQLLALWFWTIFLVASLASVRVAFTKSRCALWITSIVICLWPAGIIHSIRIGNDLPLYAFYALSFYYCLRWWRGRALNHLWYACLWASLALLTKSNALAIWGVIGVLFLIDIYQRWRYRAKRKDRVQKIYKGLMITGLCFSLTMVLNFGDNVWHYVQGTSSDWLLSNVSESINSGLKVANSPSNYLIFDTATYLQYPFISTWEDKYGRQYFWNFVWRSSLSAEFFFDGKILQAWGIANGIFLLMLLVGILFYSIQKNTLTTPHQWRRSLHRSLPWMLGIIMPFILLLAYRIKVPLSCNTDFRYIYPVLLPILYFSACVWRERSGFLLSKAFALGAPLIALSTIIWIGVLVSQ